jgi:hypothetical protein
MRDDCQSLRECLGDQHPVEWVIVMPAQLACCEPVGDTDRLVRVCFSMFDPSPAVGAEQSSCHIRATWKPPRLNRVRRP